MTTVTRIEIKYADGTVETAEGEAAEQVWQWWRSCESLAGAHGMQYRGSKLVVTKEPKADDSTRS